MRHPRRSRTNALLVLIAMGALARPPLAPAACAPSAALDAPTTLVLSGGGAKGAWEAGVAATLVRGGLAPRLVAGSSAGALEDRKSTRLNSSHGYISYAVFCL